MKVQFSRESSVVAKMIADIKATAGAHRHTINAAILGAVANAVDHNNADNLKKLQQELMANSPRELAVFNKIVSKFAPVVLEESETNVGRYKTKLVKGMMGDAKSVASRKESFNQWVETGLIKVKNPAFVEGESNEKETPKRIDVEFLDCFAFADYKPDAGKDPVKKTMSDYQKSIISKMRKDINLRAADFIDGFLRNVGIDKELNDSQRITKAEAAQLIELINKFAK